ncbi:MAG: hypothetical protein IJT66_02190 [Clostridia bacterium]|nr:hypothetical protein [Clostridia bacterium]
MDICEKVAYIKGLAEGLSLDDSTKEGKVLAAIIDLLGDITEEICEIEDGCDEMSEQLDAVDEDLSDVEELLYGDDCDDDCCDCGDEDVYEIECPSCHDVIYLDEEMLEKDGMTCPNCGTELEFDFDECDCCDCSDAVDAQDDSQE